MNVSVSFQCTKAPAAVSTPVTSDYVFYKVIITASFSLMFVTYCGYVKYCTFEEYETNLMSQFIMFYFTSSMLNMFQTLIHPSSGAATFLLYHHIGCVFCKDGGF